jgi:hypothetical protein
MKKTFLSVALFLGAALLNVQAQPGEEKGFYVKAGASYFIKVTPVEFPEVSGYNAEETVLRLSPDLSSTELVRSGSVTGSFGQGSRFSISPGYKLSKVVALEMGIHYYSSNDYTMMSQTILDPTGLIPLLQLRSVGQVKAFDISPSLVLSFASGKLFHPYTQVGIILPLAGHLEIKTRLSDPLGLSRPGEGLSLINMTRTDRIKPRPTVGFKAVLGTSYQLCPKVSLYAEAEYRNVSVSSKERETVAYSLEALHTASTTQIEHDLSDLSMAERKGIARKTSMPHRILPKTTTLILPNPWTNTALTSTSAGSESRPEFGLTYNNDMDKLSVIRQNFVEAREILDAYMNEPENWKSLVKAGDMMIECIRSGGKILSCGNGAPCVMPCTLPKK